MLGSRLAVQLWQTSVYTNKACRAVGAPVCVFGAEALLLSFVSVHNGVCRLCLREEHECNCCRGEGGSRCVSEGWPCAAAKWGGHTKGGEWSIASFVDAMGEAVSREDWLWPRLLTQGQMRARGSSETDVTASACARLLYTPNPTEPHRRAKSESNKIQMTDYRDLAPWAEFMPLGAELSSAS